ncbi:MAG: SIMPL domain-containing protein [Gammaproteobacteria bacterium]
MKRLALLLVCVLAVPASARADDDPPRYNQVRLQAQQSESVSNDTMHVTLNTYAEMQDSSKLAARINSDMDWALAKARQYADVKVSSGGYQTWPVTRKEVTVAWRGQQDLMLESRDTEKLSQLTGQLQEKLKIKSMSFSVSDEKRTAVENRLIDATLNAFRVRAGIVGDNLNAKGYRIVELNVGASAQRPPVMYQARMASVAMEASDSVAVEGGESDVQVTVSGSIELQIP